MHLVAQYTLGSYRRNDSWYVCCSGSIEADDQEGNSPRVSPRHLEMDCEGYPQRDLPTWDLCPTDEETCERVGTLDSLMTKQHFLHLHMGQTNLGIVCRLILSCPGSSVGRALCLVNGVSWVRVPPRAAPFSFENGVVLVGVESCNDLCLVVA